MKSLDSGQERHICLEYLYVLTKYTQVDEQVTKQLNTISLKPGKIRKNPSFMSYEMLVYFVCFSRFFHKVFDLLGKVIPGSPLVVLSDVIYSFLLYCGFLFVFLAPGRGLDGNWRFFGDWV